MSEASQQVQDEDEPVVPAVIERLVAAHRDFLGFVEARVRSRAQAEEILQAAFVRAIEKAGTIRDEESSVAWFYRLLRNAITDAHRRHERETRALDRSAAQSDAPEEAGLREVICGCMHTLLPTIKPEYAEMLRRVDLDEEPVAVVAASLQISTNNATVRLHRARQALRRQLERSCGTCAAHGCLDCSCKSGASSGGCHAP